jgi:RNA polymerase sigma-70 factor (ECF subfamily)
MSNESDQERDARRDEMRRILEMRIDALPDRCRTVFVLRALEELSVEETAPALQLPEATVRTRYFRARALLRESLARDIDHSLEEAFSFAGARCDRIIARVLARIKSGT